ncbi:hypothetical protein MRX96_005814 [Rhipicephalus microplus]
MWQFETSVVPQVSIACRARLGGGGHSSSLHRRRAAAPLRAREAEEASLPSMLLLGYVTRSGRREDGRETGSVEREGLLLGKGNTRSGWRAACLYRG